MLELFYQGNVIFMGILTFLLMIIIAITVYRTIQISKGRVDHWATFRHLLTRIKSVGLFALMFGVFAQLLGLYQVFSHIEQGGEVAPPILAGGLKVSMIPTVYGVIIFLIAYLIWMGLDKQVANKSE